MICLCRGGCGLNATMQKPFSGDKEAVFCEECYWDDYKSYEEYEIERRLRYAENEKQIVERTRSWTLFKRELAQVGEAVRLKRWQKAIEGESERRQAAILTAGWAARFVYEEVLERHNQSVALITKLDGKVRTRATLKSLVMAWESYDEVAAEELAAGIKYNKMLDA